MEDPWLVAGVAAVFAVAGFVKGVVGLGLPTVAMGLLGLALPPAEAAAMLVVPSLATNAWQMLDGRALGVVARRTWPLLAGVVTGTWAGAALGLAMTGPRAADAGVWLGLALAAYGALGLAAPRLSVPQRAEAWAGPLAGAATGAVTAATGIFVVPAVPYLAALGLGRDALVQALGLAFTVSTVALAAVLVAGDAWSAGAAGASALALLPAVLGLVAGARWRRRLDEAVFRRVFFAGLLALGAWIAVRAWS